MMAINGRIQREGGGLPFCGAAAVRPVSGSVGPPGRDTEFKLSADRGDEFAHGGGPDPAQHAKAGLAAAGICSCRTAIDTLKVTSRNFH